MPALAVESTHSGASISKAMLLLQTSQSEDGVLQVCMCVGVCARAAPNDPPSGRLVAGSTQAPVYACSRVCSHLARVR